MLVLVVECVQDYVLELVMVSVVDVQTDVLVAVLDVVVDVVLGVSLDVVQDVLVDVMGAHHVLEVVRMDALLVVVDVQDLVPVDVSIVLDV